MALNQRGSAPEVASISTGKTLEIYGDGNQTRDFIYIDDLIRAILLAASVSGIGGEIFQIATNVETTVKELVEKLLLVLSDAGYESDTSKAWRMLGWKAEVELIEGLRRTVEWFTGL